jgi:phosphoserine phosphatase
VNRRQAGSKSASGLKFASVVLDVDSTLTEVEGIEWLAERRSADVARRVREMTHRAMAGTTPLEDVYGERLALVRPGRDDVAALADAYSRATTAGALEAIEALRHAGVRVLVVSGGVREAVIPFARSLGVEEADVHAVSIRFDVSGRYSSFDSGSPLTRRGGKATVVLRTALAAPVLAVGDGGTDAELKTMVVGGTRAADAFAAFVGHSARPPVVAVADYVIHRFMDLVPLVLGEGGSPGDD